MNLGIGESIRRIEEIQEAVQAGYEAASGETLAAKIQRDREAAKLAKTGGLGGWVGAGVENALKEIWYSVGRTMGVMADGAMSGMVDKARLVNDPDILARGDIDLGEHFKSILTAATDEQKDDPVYNAIRLLSAIKLAIDVIMQTSAITGQKYVVQPLMANIRPSLLNVAELQEMIRRNPEEAPHFRETLAKLGHPDGDINRLNSLAEQLTPLGTIITAYLRGYAKDEDIDALLAKMGFSAQTTDWLKRGSLYVPQTPDLIRFAVREVYDPEISTAYGQAEGLAKNWANMEADAKAAGLSEDTFRKYWMAHWELPSIMQGFEMFHRGVIDKAKLESLFVALDIMPGWREDLTAIAYRPYTRVDVRRMHKLGILDNEQTKRAYMDLGYDEEKAQGMLDFTIAYNADPEESEKTSKDKEKEKERDLTKSDILRVYKAGIIGASTASEFLGNMGYDSQEVDYLISRIDFEVEQDRIESYLKLYHDQYIRGQLTTKDLEEKFGGLGLTGEQQGRLFEQWAIEDQTKAVIPSKAELVRFLQKEIIDQDTFKDQLRRRRYTEQAIAWYIEDITGEKPQ